MMQRYIIQTPVGKIDFSMGELSLEDCKTMTDWAHDMITAHLRNLGLHHTITVQGQVTNFGFYSVILADDKRIEFDTAQISDVEGLARKLRTIKFDEAKAILERNHCKFNLLPTRFPAGGLDRESTLHRLTRPVNVQDAHARQVGGDHYKNLKVEPWKAMESWLTPTEFKGFLKGNIIKYIARANSDKEPHDLMIQKAEHYMQKLSEVMAAEAAQAGEAKL